MSKYLGGIATDVYGVTGVGVQSLLPRSKFQFSVSMTLVDNNGTHKSYPFQRIVSIEQPSYTSRVSTINQYNKKRLVQTGIDYSPISMTAYDTRDAYIENFLKSYSEYYYGNTMTVTEPTAFNYDLLNEQLATSSGFTSTGMRLPTGNQKYFIKTMKIIMMSSAQDVRVTTIYNLMINSIGTDQLNYSDSQPLQYQIGFLYEGFDIKTGNTSESYFAEQVEEVNALNNFSPLL